MMLLFFFDKFGHTMVDSPAGKGKRHPYNSLNEKWANLTTGVKNSLSAASLGKLI
jgi:hypothetical protein